MFGQLTFQMLFQERSIFGTDPFPRHQQLDQRIGLVNRPGAARSRQLIEIDQVAFIRQDGKDEMVFRHFAELKLKRQATWPGVDRRGAQPTVEHNASPQASVACRPESPGCPQVEIQTSRHESRTLRIILKLRTTRTYPAFGKPFATYRT